MKRRVVTGISHERFTAKRLELSKKFPTQYPQTFSNGPATLHLHREDRKIENLYGSDCKPEIRRRIDKITPDGSSIVYVCMGWSF
ncbi:hypothetical protein Trydic_g2300 [Trypoxylus dichotomus]